MKHKNMKINMISAGVVLVLFIISMLIPEIQIVTKALAIAVYVTVSYVQVMDEKKKGEAFEKSLLFSVALVLVFIYLFYFV